jgi:serine/threonine protein kinase
VAHSLLQPLPELAARALYRDLVGALDYLHRKGIVHHEVRLDNCLLFETSVRLTLKLGSFGLSCVSVDRVIYAAPEQGPHGPAVDVWASGIVLFAMLTGVYPSDDVDADVSTAEWLREVAPSLGELLQCLFEPDPVLRITAAQLRRHPWVNTGYSNRVPRVPVNEGEGEEVKRDMAVFIRADVLVVLESEFGFPFQAVVESLLAGAVNLFSATYHLLEAQHTRPLHLLDDDRLVLTRRVAQYLAQRLHPPSVESMPASSPLIDRHEDLHIALWQHELEQLKRSLEAGVATKLGSGQHSAPIRCTRQASPHSSLSRSCSSRSLASFEESSEI